MFLNLKHKQLDVYKLTRSFVKQCYTHTKKFPPEEKFALVQQLRRAAISVYLNLAEGCTRESLLERKRFFQISRGSLIEVDAAFEISVDLGYVSEDKLAELGAMANRCFMMLSRMINNKNST